MPFSAAQTSPDHPPTQPLFRRWGLIVFDFDGTLVDSQHGIGHCMTAAFEGHGLAAPEMTRIRGVVGLALEVAISELLPLAERRHVPAVAQRYREAAAVLRGSATFHEPLFEGARETLCALDRPELCLGIATGKNLRGLQFSLEYHDLKEHFLTLQTPDIAPSKPHPAMVLQAMAACGSAPEETVVVGDTSFDMEMARAAGATAVGVAWGYHPEDRLYAAGAQSVINDFKELIPTLQILEEAGR